MILNKLVIVGCGNVGMAYAYSLLNQCLNINELVLIDVDKEKLFGKVADLNHSVYNLNTSTKVILGNYSDCQDADIICITAGPSQSALKSSRMEDLHKANTILKGIVSEINKTNFSGIYLIATNPLDVMTYVTWKYANCSPQKVIGSGTLLDTARLRYILSEKYHKPITEMTGLVLGEHGDSQFIPWSTVNVEKLPESEMTNIENAVKKAGFDVSRSQGFTSYGIASALSRITRAIIFDEKVCLPVCSYLEDYGIFTSTPSIIGKDGIEKSNTLDLENREKSRLENSIQVIKTAIGNL